MNTTQTQVFSSEDVIVRAIWDRAEKLYAEHRRLVGFRPSWKFIGLSARLRWYEHAQTALGVR